jgi:hypothetical protein
MCRCAYQYQTSIKSNSIICRSFFYCIITMYYLLLSSFCNCHCHPSFFHAATCKSSRNCRTCCPFDDKVAHLLFVFIFCTSTDCSVACRWRTCSSFSCCSFVLSVANVRRLQDKQKERVSKHISPKDKKYHSPATMPITN